MTDSLLDILYQDDHYVVIDKPSGLLVHRSPIDRREHRFALQMLRDQLGQHVYPVHRLDKPTSGLLVFGLHSEAAARMQLAFRERQVQKTYHAVVRGFAEPGGVIDYPLSDKREKEEKRHADDVRPPQEALTHYKCLDQVELDIPLGRYPCCRYSLVEMQPHTGRKHQLRRHMKHLNHHMIGDTRYGDGKHNKLFRDHFDNQRLLLFASKLQLVHPYNLQKLQVETALPAKQKSLFEALGWNPPGQRNVTLT